MTPADSELALFQARGLSIGYHNGFNSGPRDGFAPQGFLSVAYMVVEVMSLESLTSTEHEALPPWLSQGGRSSLQRWLMVVSKAWCRLGDRARTGPL